MYHEFPPLVLSMHPTYHRRELYVNCTKDRQTHEYHELGSSKEKILNQLKHSPNLCWLIISFPVKRTLGEAFSRTQKPLFCCRASD
ncbi:hypothetical protein CEXT_149681 [Caerostris extrusa]|uniref:Uncharacterized protein n=1 Tax=Caerostris extrusa TaxID=172846 RepID=A0AAV4XS57_CAEEX|nr:hypothetical protein CEXT_149681 [Caerostris extrusa]